LAMLTAIRRASSRVNSPASSRVIDRPGWRETALLGHAARTANRRC
jgi:hypothetical protein